MGPLLRPAGVGLAATLEALGLMAGHAVATPLLGKRRRHWGATRSEVAAVLPGDDLIPDPKWGFTYGIGINVPAAQVWPWIVQLGQGRGGFYSYQTLENLVGCQIRNVAEIRPELQHPALGDEIRLAPEGTVAMRIALLDPPRALVLHGEPGATDAPGEALSGGFATSTWLFHLDESPSGSTRLLMRGRSDYSSELVNRLFFGPFPMEPIEYVMSRKMMLEIKRLAEWHNGGHRAGQRG